jgi:hypoxanthine phosphoribosyltransferase
VRSRSFSGSILIEQDVLSARVIGLAREIRDDLGHETPLHLVGVLKGAFIFVADLIRALGGPVSCDFLSVSSYGTGTTTSGEVRLTKDLDSALDHRDVLIVEDIVDTGLTLSYLRSLLLARQPNTLRTVALLNKPSRRQQPVPLEYVGFDIPDRFVVGYGLDADGRYRELPFIGVIAHEEA